MISTGGSVIKLIKHQAPAAPPNDLHPIRQNNATIQEASAGSKTNGVTDCYSNKHFALSD